MFPSFILLSNKSAVNEDLLSTYISLKKCLFFREREREKERERERERERMREGQRERTTQNLKQALGSELSAQSPAQGLNPQAVR